jgi:hypothetical protein
MGRLLSEELQSGFRCLNERRRLLAEIGRRLAQGGLVHVKKKPTARKDTEQLIISVPRGLLAVLRPISL